MAPQVLDSPIFLSTHLAGPRERRMALAVVLVSTFIFIVAVPFAHTQLAAVWPFIPIYESALAINDLITAVLLISQVVILRSRALLVLAAGYLFSALMAVPHMLSFPDLFAPGGAMGAGAQTTAWLYFLWHGGFPLAVIGYALMKDRNGSSTWLFGRVAPTIALAIVGIVAIVAAFTLLATKGHALLPAVMDRNQYTSAQMLVATVTWMASLAALGVVWWRRPHSVLDLWLMVVMCAWIFDIALAAVFNHARFDLGFYAGRIYGLAAASFVLCVMLLETGALYARAARALERDRLERERRLNEVQAELIHLARVSELGQMASGLAHEVNQPLAALGSYLRASQRLIEQGDVRKASAALELACEQADRAGQIIMRLRSFVKKSKTARQVESLFAVIEEVLELALISPEGKRTTATSRLDPEAVSAYIDKIQIQQVLLNLTRNAVEAMARSPRRELLITTSLSDESLIEVMVADTGPGLAPEVREKLFQPFVTTKSTGMGVGLSICHAIVETHGGRMWVEDNPGGGTVFRFTVPRAGSAGYADVQQPQAAAANMI
jgi:signal transduction histidine kinase